MRIQNLALIAAMALAAPRASRAVDGTTDVFINAATGATISASGSYRLVSDVTMTANVNAINVNAANVTLDLGGHKITGFGTSSTGIQCTFTGFSLENGSVKGFGFSGADLNSQVIVRNVRFEGNNTNGGASIINAGADAVIENCIVINNSPGVGGVTTGITVGSGSRVAGNTVENNDSSNSTAIGISTGNDCVVEGNVVRNQNGVSASQVLGIRTGTDCVIRKNSVVNNDNAGSGGLGDAIGILASSGSMVQENTCSSQTAPGSAIGISGDGASVIDNDCRNNIATGNGSGVGVNIGSRGLARGNRCDGNGGAGTGTSCGILMNNACTAQGNTCVANTGGALSHGIRVVSTFNLVIGNSLIGHTSGGIIFLAAANNRCQENLCRETEAVETTAPGVAPASSGAGDLANVLY